MPRATINDVAELAGVSIKTVSRVANREPHVHPSTRDRVEKAIAALNYQPNQSARNLASHRARLIGLVYDDPSVYEIPSAGYLIRLQQGTLRACRSANFELLIHPCNFREKSVGDELRTVIQQVRPAGLVVAAPLSNMPKIVQAIRATGTPFIPLSPGVSSSRNFFVATNDREISAEMTRYLASLGHKEIAFITGDPDHKAVGLRFEGYKDGLKQSQIKFAPGLVCAGNNSFGSGESCGLELMQLPNPPTAIFAANDDMAAGVIRAAERLKVKVPEQLSVAGCDDSALAQQVYPALTTIRQPLSTMAETAAMALVEAARGAVLPRHGKVIPSRLIIRDSTSGPSR